jgi:DNA polymerase II large subunit
MRGVPSRILPPKKAARYLQLESKIRAVQAYDVAATVPLIK